MFEEMHLLGIWAEVITYAVTVSTCAKGTEWQSVMGLLQQMPSLGFQADVIMYALPSAPARRAGSGSVPWNVVSPSSTISVCRVCQQWQLALTPLHEM